jgi:hypothetical protein
MLLLAELDLVLLALVAQALVVVVDRDRQDLLGLLLADHVLVEDAADLGRCGQTGLDSGGLLIGLRLIADDVVAQLDAFIADEHARTRDEFAYFVLALAAEGAVKKLLAGALLVGHHSVFRALSVWHAALCAREA